MYIFIHNYTHYIIYIPIYSHIHAQGDPFNALIFPTDFCEFEKSGFKYSKTRFSFFQVNLLFIAVTATFSNENSIIFLINK